MTDLSLSRQRTPFSLKLLSRAMLLVWLVPAAQAAHAADLSTDAAQTPATQPASATQATGARTASTAGGVQTLSTITVAGAAAPASRADGNLATRASIGALGNQALIDVPFNVTSYTEKAIENSQAQTLGDIVETDPGVRVTTGYGNYSQVYVIRGFELYGDDIALNGLYGLTPRQLIMPEALSQVDIFKGASTFVNGIAPGGSGIGGSIDLRTKYAGDTPLARSTTEVSSSGELGEHIDVGQRFGADKQFGIRLNQTVEGGNLPVEGATEHKQQTALGLDYRGDRLRLYGDFIYQKQDIKGNRDDVYLDGDQIPGLPSSASHNYAQPWEYSNLEDTLGMLRAEYDVAPNWTLYAGGGIRRTTEMGEYASPTYTSKGDTNVDYPLTTAYKENALTGQIGVRGHFDTGPVSHAVNASVLVNSLKSYTAYNFGEGFATDLYDTPDVAFPAVSSKDGNIYDPGLTSRTLMRSEAVSDTLGFFNDRLLFTAGLRHQNILVNGYDAITSDQDSAYNKSATSPIFGVVYKLTPQFSIYANSTQSLTQGSTAPVGSTNVGEVLPPYKAKQVEAGIKYDGQRYGGTLALFQIRQPEAVTDSTTGAYGVAGVQRNRGVELSGYVSPVHGLRLIGGATYIQGLVQGTAGGTDDGNAAIGVPRWLLNANVEWDVPGVAGVTLIGRAVYTDSQYVDSANNLQIPAWTRFDAGVRYTTQLSGHDTTFRFMVTNLANRRYWASSLGGYLTQGDPRTAWLSMSIDF